MNSVTHDPDKTVATGAPKGFIAFCETNLRYEKGLKAWIILGPYLLGAVVFESVIHAVADSTAIKVALWIGFLAYVIAFPKIWRRALKSRNPTRTLTGLQNHPPAQGLNRA